VFIYLGMCSINQSCASTINSMTCSGIPSESSSFGYSLESLAGVLPEESWPGCAVHPRPNPTQLSTP
jgi:hypothetical protein